MSIVLPKISLITPVYNGEKYIEKTFLSIYFQEYPNLEHILMDGGSTDNTMKIVEKYRDKISFVHSGKDKGIYDALNRGFAKSTGEIMCWLNADDLHHPNCLWQVAEIFNRFPEVEWITGAPTNFDEKGICREVIPQRKWSVYQYLAGDYFTIQQESVFWRRSLWEKAGSSINDQLKLAGDFELWLRFFRTGTKLYTTTAPLAGFRRHSAEQLSAIGSNYSVEANTILKNLELTEAEIKTLKKIKKLERLNRLPFLRGKLKVNEQLAQLYDFPPKITFDFNKNTFILQK